MGIIVPFSEGLVHLADGYSAKIDEEARSQDHPVRGWHSGMYSEQAPIVERSKIQRDQDSYRVLAFLATRALLLWPQYP